MFKGRREALTRIGEVTVLVLAMSLAGLWTHPGTGAEKRVGQERYYIAVRVSLVHPRKIDVFGATNLPVGAIVDIHVADFLGQGSEALTNDTSAVVGKDGVFRVEVEPKRGMTFRRNMICNVTFAPTHPHQPASVIAIVGRRGEHLGDPFKNPQNVGNDRMGMLVATTVIQ